MVVGKPGPCCCCGACHGDYLPFAHREPGAGLRRRRHSVAAVGRAKISGPLLKPGQVVIDVGINEDPDNPGKYCGDVDFEAVDPSGEVTPVPGGVGSVTTIVLCKHTVMACEMQNS